MYKARALGRKVLIILSEYLSSFGLKKITYEKKTQQSTSSKEIELKAFAYGNKKRNQVQTQVLSKCFLLHCRLHHYLFSDSNSRTLLLYYIIDC